MKCEEAIPLIDLLLDDELSPQIAAGLLEHTKLCPSCQAIWDSRIMLRERFLKLSKSISVPDDALTRMDTQIGRCSHVIASRLPAMYAAAILAVGLVVFYFYQTMSHEEIHKMGNPIAVSEIVGSYQQPNALLSNNINSADIKDLSHKVGFPVALLNLPSWQLISKDVVKLPGHSSCMVRLVYTSQINGKQQQLSMYEACQGQITASGLKKHNIGGRLICCGKVDNRSVVYFPKNGRDHLLISSIPEPELMALALRT